MKVVSIDLIARKVTIEWKGKVRELDFDFHDNGNRISIPIAGRTGMTGVKLWRGYQSFYLKDGEWRRGCVGGGLNGKPFTPVCFLDEVPDGLKSQR